MATPKNNLLGLEIQELTGILASFGQKSYRAKQLFEGMYGQRLTSLEDISTFPAALKASLTSAGFQIQIPSAQKRFTSVDGTVRYLIGLADGQSVETVWMPEGDGSELGDEGDGRRRFSRATICVSSQVGCAVNCHFCLTALLGLKRNLTAGEIVGQIIAVLNDHSVEINKERINIVFMGQGEPFHNYDNFIKAVRLLVSGVKIPESRMTVSTSGIVPKIIEMGQEAVRPRLAISLNASNDEMRSKLMPINRKWKIANILKVASEYPLRSREVITFEYVLLGGENDSQESAQELVRLIRGAKGLKAKVNLIAWNPGPEVPYSTPSDDAVKAFQQFLIQAGVPTFIRRPRGRDIYAACGQLKATEELLTIGS